ncbi:MAG: cupin domain-containing protein [Lachnospirales bacterium]
MNNFNYNNEIETKDLGNGVKRKIMAYSDNIMMVEMSFQKDAVGTLHSHPHEQVTYILEGEFEFTVGEQKKIVKKGDVLYKQPNIIHGAVAITDGLLIDVFTPAREDFLE